MKKSVWTFNKKGFTLIEIMIVVLIISVLLMIGVPGWVGARDRTQAKTCVSNLRQIRYAKEAWAMGNNKGSSDVPGWSDLTIYLKQQPSCPGGGNYTVGSISEDPTCSIGGQHAIDSDLH